MPQGRAAAWPTVLRRHGSRRHEEVRRGMCLRGACRRCGFDMPCLFHSLTRRSCAGQPARLDHLQERVSHKRFGEEVIEAYGCEQRVITIFRIESRDRNEERSAKTKHPSYLFG